MTALPLLDALLPSGNTVPARALQVAEQLTADAIAAVRRIQAWDTDLAAGGDEPYDPKLARVFRRLYESWAADAEGVLDRLSLLRRLGAQPAGFEELLDSYGRTRAMLSITLEEVEAALAEVNAGRTYTLDEVRRELRLGVQP